MRPEINALGERARGAKHGGDGGRRYGGFLEVRFVGGGATLRKHTSNSEWKADAWQKTSGRGRDGAGICKFNFQIPAFLAATRGKLPNCFGMFLENKRATHNPPPRGAPESRTSRDQPQYFFQSRRHIVKFILPHGFGGRAASPFAAVCLSCAWICLHATPLSHGGQGTARPTRGRERRMIGFYDVARRDAARPDGRGKGGCFHEGDDGVR